MAWTEGWAWRWFRDSPSSNQFNCCGFSISPKWYITKRISNRVGINYEAKMHLNIV